MKGSTGSQAGADEAAASIRAATMAKDRWGIFANKSDGANGRDVRGKLNLLLYGGARNAPELGDEAPSQGLDLSG